MPNIFHAPIEAVPVDCGWLGFAFIFVNGVLLSYIIVKNGVDTTERLLLSVGLGFGFTYVLMISIGILWEISLLTVILTQTSLLLVLLPAALRCGLKLKGQTRLKGAAIPKVNRVEATLLAVIGAYVCIAAYQTLAYPAVEWDSLAYGVNYAKIIFENGRIPLIAGPSIGLEMSASYPLGTQLLAVYLYTFAGGAKDFYFRILQPIFGLATLIATYKFSADIAKKRVTAVFAAFILASIPTFWELFVHETYLMCLTFMLTMATFLFFKAYNTEAAEARKYEDSGTLFCCFAALTSYIGLAAFGLLLLYAVNKRLSVKRSFWLVTLAAPIVLPWYLRNFLLLGNPVFPFLSIGKYLDPLLLSSTMQHFRNWSTVPFFGLINLISMIGTVVLILAIIYLHFAKPKQFMLIFPCYLLLAGVAIMALHIPFMRYLIIALPSLAVIFSIGVTTLITKLDKRKRATSMIFIVFLLISTIMVLPCINSFKPSPLHGNDKWSYLAQIFEEADAWKWINENTPADARVATYDIKEYYIERDIFTLDGREAAPLYRMNAIEDALNFLKDRNVTYILSVPWAAPLDTRMPPAYKWCVLTRYLGDLNYLPPVYVGLNGTAVYHVGPIEEETVHALFAEKNFTPPLKHVTVNLTITNSTTLPSGKLHMPIPVDYREGVMIVSVNSANHSVSIELWQGIIPDVVTNPSGTYRPLKQGPEQPANSTGAADPALMWQINKWGYFTIFVIDREERFTENFNVTVDIRFYNYWDVKTLSASEQQL
ncbi:MAG: hypothetical protein WHU54_06135 [Candidatus Bathyarchaeia archaeon]